MEVTFEKDHLSVSKRYFPSLKEIEIMKFIFKNERIDFRARKYGEENPKDETGTFLYNECEDLIGQEFIEEDSVWWNSYIFTDLGKYYIEDNILIQGGEKA